MKPHSDYTYELVGPVLCIVDLDQGAMSVTNNIENVLGEIRDEIKELGIPFPPIAIYRDSEGMWDGVERRKTGLSFYPLQQKDREAAVEMAMKRYVSG